MFKLEQDFSGNWYANYNFTLDELYWLLAYIPESDDFKKTIWQGINLLEAKG